MSDMISSLVVVLKKEMHESQAKELKKAIELMSHVQEVRLGVADITAEYSAFYRAKAQFSAAFYEALMKVSP